ncbi:hypothetical protein HanXRQr2_Chr13g0569091 [Helianthus annuus]|uniref:Uncharacterized protein n=1 Tax=Helianthus annuus TaxID=4232 RepID=A0A9K3EEQ6_HELAN|nr:hypothetical protein HanXRQr2_Chr13g0569091 [Helianthus annuus]
MLRRFSLLTQIEGFDRYDHPVQRGICDIRMTIQFKEVIPLNHEHVLL